MISIAILDMDGTLVDSERIALKAWVLAGQEMGISIPEDFITGYFGMNRQQIDSRYLQRYGQDFPIHVLRARRMAIGRELATETPIPAKPGAPELLERLAEKNIPIALATGSEYVTAHNLLNNLGLWHYFRYWVCGSMVARGKPAPDIYLEALRKSEKQAEHSIVIEDTENGAHAALAAGCRTIVVPDLRSPSPELRSRLLGCYDSLRDVIPLLEHL